MSLGLSKSIFPLASFNTLCLYYGMWLVSRVLGHIKFHRTNNQACVDATLIWNYLPNVSNGLGKKQLDFNQFFLLIILPQ